MEAVEQRPAKWLHRFEAIPDERIGELPLEWNVLDRYDSNTRLIHYTQGGPWLKGCENHPCRDLWFDYLAGSGAGNHFTPNFQTAVPST